MQTMPIGTPGARNVNAAELEERRGEGRRDKKDRPWHERVSGAICLASSAVRSWLGQVVIAAPVSQLIPVRVIAGDLYEEDESEKTGITRDRSHVLCGNSASGESRAQVAQGSRAPMELGRVGGGLVLRGMTTDARESTLPDCRYRSNS